MGFKMKRPVLCIFLAMFMAFTAVEPFAGLNAAELWNSRKSTVTDKKTYKFYKKREEGKKPVTLFNAQSPRKSPDSKYGSKIKQIVDSYKDVKLMKQNSPKLWDRMSPGAVKNRWADTDNALQIEYETRKATASHMISLYRQMKSDQAKAEKEYQSQLNQYYEDKRAEELERQAEKEDALNGGSSGNRVYRSSKKKNRNIIYKKKSSSRSKETRVKLNKPKPLFNSPNR